MISWLRFEDTYGMSDIFMASRGVKLPAADKRQKYYEMGDILAEIGMSNLGCLRVDLDEVPIIKKHNIGRVIFIFDVDANEIKRGNEEKEAIYRTLKRGDIKDTLEASVRRLQKVNPDIQIEFVQVVMCAETIMLYQYLYEIGCASHLENLIHSEDTSNFHLRLLYYMNRNLLYRTEHAKRTVEYLDYKILKRNIKYHLINTRRYEGSFENEINYHLLDWIEHDMNLEASHFDLSEVLDFLDHVNDWYATKYSLPAHDFIIIDKEIDGEFIGDIVSTHARLGSFRSAGIY